MYTEPKTHIKILYFAQRTIIRCVCPDTHYGRMLKYLFQILFFGGSHSLCVAYFLFLRCFFWLVLARTNLALLAVSTHVMLFVYIIYLLLQLHSGTFLSLSLISIWFVCVVYVVVLIQLYFSSASRSSKQTIPTFSSSLNFFPPFFCSLSPLSDCIFADSLGVLTVELFNAYAYA